MSRRHLLAVLWRRKTVLVATFLAALAAAAAVTFSLPKTYSTVAYVWINATSDPRSDFEATQLSQILTRTYAELIQTRNVAVEVAERLPFDMSPKAVESSVEVAAPNQSQLLAIEAEASSPQRAKAIADTYADVFVERARLFAESGATDSRVTLAESAPIVEDPSRPRPLLYLLIGALVAAIVAVAAALLRERLDQRIDVDPAAVELFGLPILAHVPARRRGDLMSVVRESETAVDRAAEEAFRLLVANIAFAALGERPQTLAIVSTQEQEGKSTCALNVARAATGLDLRVLLVDADLRRPSLSAQLATGAPGPGLAHYLVGAHDLDDVVVDLLGSTLSLVPAGPLPPNPGALLGSRRLDEFDRAARAEHDLVVYDTPPLSVGADASLIAGRTAGTILVIDVKKARRAEVLTAIAQLERAQATLLGVVLNRVDVRRSSYYYGDDGPRRRRRRGRDVRALAGRE